MRALWRRLGIAAEILLTGIGVVLVLQSDGCAGFSPDASFSVHPDGHSIVFAGWGDGGQGIYTLNLDTRKAACMLDGPEIEGWPAFMPDGQHIVFTSRASADAHLTCS
ncbi:MAG TPA: hypothetical protein VGM37_00045 [Armatimonadota bacterium]